MRTVIRFLQQVLGLGERPPRPQLRRPFVWVSATVNPTTVGGHDGAMRFSWSAVQGAESYRLAIAVDGAPKRMIGETRALEHTLEGVPAGRIEVFVWGVRAA